MSEPTTPEPTAPSKRTRSTRVQSARGTKKTPQQTATLPCPAPDDRVGWKVYWESLEQPWRTEPEIDAERQKFLAERRAIKPDIEKGVYPFRGVLLDRADVEWLLTTHESDGFTGPIDWNHGSHRGREGLDLRGASLQGAYLHGLPLARLRGGLSFDERERTPPQLREKTATHFEQADISSAHLEQANLSFAHFEGAILRGTYLSGADLFHARLENATLTESHMESADLRFAFFNIATYLRGIILTADNSGPAWLAGIRWGEADLSLVNWSQLSELEDERWARQPRDKEGKPKARDTRVKDYQAAVRANRKLAAVLRSQGLNEDADHFAYHAQVMQRVVLRRQRKFLKYLGSWLLWLIAGYGYRPLRTLLIYLCTIATFAAAYFAVTHTLPTQTYPLAWYEALVLSISCFHGRGFFQPVQNLGDPIAILASIEAVFGLLIEVSFIATFTQRFFGR